MYLRDTASLSLEKFKVFLLSYACKYEWLECICCILHGALWLHLRP